MKHLVLEHIWPSGEEQLALLRVINRKYPMPRKYPKPYKSYPHWRVDSWFPRADACYFHLEYGEHRGDSMIQADYFAWKWSPNREAWVQVNRQTHELVEISKDEYDLTRGSRMNERGIMEWAKKDNDGNVTWKS